MDWLVLVTPGLAVLAIVCATAAAVASWRALRAIRALEALRRDGAPFTQEEEPLATWIPSSVITPDATAPRSRRAWVLGAVLVVAVGSAVALAWPTNDTARAGKPVVDPATQVPTEITPVADPAAVRVIVLNGAGIAGAAGERVSPRVARGGWTMLESGNAPRSDVARSLVQYGSGHKDAAAQIARRLGITTITPFDGIDPAGADVAVVVGRDLAR